MRNSDKLSQKMENLTKFPSAEQHPIFQGKTIFEVNRARNDRVEHRDLGPEDLRQRLKMEVYFNVNDLLDGHAADKEVFDRIFRLMDIYAGKAVRK
ncbi:MAG: hypothetical protein ABSD08_08170 [Xanthobacteraceae bacterium]